MRVNVHPLWLSSTAIAVLVLLGYRWLEAQWAPWLVALLGIIHLFVYGKVGRRQPRWLVLPHTLIVLTTVGSVVLHVEESVGFAPGWSRIIMSFAVAEASSLTRLGHLASSAAIVVALTALVFGLRHRIYLQFGSFLELLYVISALNVAWDYSFHKVMASSLGPSAFLAAAGIFALEFSVLFHLLSLVLLLLSRREQGSG